MVRGCRVIHTCLLTCVRVFVSVTGSKIIARLLRYKDHNLIQGDTQALNRGMEKVTSVIYDV